MAARRKTGRAAQLRQQIELTETELDEVHQLDSGLMATSVKIAGLNERLASLQTQLAEEEARTATNRADAVRHRREAQHYAKRATDWALAKRGASKQIRDDLLPKILEALASQDESASALKALA